MTDLHEILCRGQSWLVNIVSKSLWWSGSASGFWIGSDSGSTTFSDFSPKLEIRSSWNCNQRSIMSQRLSCITLVVIWTGIRILDPNLDHNYKVEYLENYMTDLHEILYRGKSWHANIVSKSLWWSGSTSGSGSGSDIINDISWKLLDGSSRNLYHR